MAIRGCSETRTIPTAVAQALNLYAGAFLPEDEGESWSVRHARAAARQVHPCAGDVRSRRWRREGHVDEAIRLYLRGIDADVIVEAFHRGLMRCYRRAGRMTEAVSAYRRLRQTLSVVLGVAPSAESEALYQEIVVDLATEPDGQAA